MLWVEFHLLAAELLPMPLEDAPNVPDSGVSVSGDNPLLHEILAATLETASTEFDLISQVFRSGAAITAVRVSFVGTAAGVVELSRNRTAVAGRSYSRMTVTSG